MQLTACMKADTDTLKDLEAFAIPPETKTINLKITNYCPEELHQLKDVFFINESQKVEKGEMVMDLDRDGLSNAVDNSPYLNLDYRLGDSNNDGYSDLLMFVVGITSADQQNIRLCLNPTDDFDEDGLNDCEEHLLHTNEQDFDTDGDGLPDIMEIKYGMNPLDVNDAQQDADNDGYTNYREIQRNSPVFESSTEVTEKFATSTEIVSYNTTETPCHTVFAKDIPIVNVSNGNLIRFSLIEEVSGNPADTKLFRKKQDYTFAVSRSVKDKAVFEIEFNKLQKTNIL
jgi:hypothetical protein